MKFKKLPVIAASAALCFVACSEDSVANAVDELGGEFPASSSGVIPGNSSGVIPGNSSAVIPGTSSAVIPGYDPESSSSGVIPGTSSGVIPGSSSSVIPGYDPESSSSAGVIPGSSAVVPGSSSSTPWHQYSSNSTIPGGAGDDENDNEDSRTLDGTQILLKLSGTSATVENNNGCVEVADKKATITCPGAYYVTGESSDFQLVVNTPAAENEGNTGIYLYNATIKSSNSPILVANADKTVLHLVKGTTNVVEDGNGNHQFTKANTFLRSHGQKEITW
jgi:hypothetical protein